MRLNFDYQNAYKLWMFLGRYDILGIEYKLTQSKVDFDKNYLTQLHLNIVGSYLTMKTEHSLIPNKDTKISLYKPKFKEIKLDYDMSDERLVAKGLGFGIDVKKETPAQIEARQKRAAAAEERRKKREEAKQKAKELARQKREEAKQLAIKRALERKEKEKQRKLALQEKKRKVALALAEKKRIEKMKKDEEQKLEKARQQVRLMAEQRKKTEGQ